MKKILFVLLISLSLITSFTSCNFSFSGKDLLTPPKVEAAKTAVVISIPLENDPEYINIYRKDVNDTSETVVSVGMLYPTENDSYIYFDSLIHKNHTYVYMIRYYIDKTYFSTDWSSEVTVADAYEEDAILKYKDVSGSIGISESDYTLRFNGEIYAPDIPSFDLEYKPMLIVATETKEQLFELPGIGSDVLLSLKGILPSDFLNTTITIKGIVGQKVDYVDPDNLDTNPDIKRIYWTEPTELRVSGYSDKTLFIPQVTGTDGLDYSK